MYLNYLLTNSHKKIYQKLLLLITITTLLSSCAVHKIQKTQPFDASARWIMLPIMNHSDTPEAGARAADIAETLLRSAGITSLSSYVPTLNDDKHLPELDQQKSLQEAKTWAVQQKYKFAVSGSVQEWRYKSGLDAEPAAGITLTVMDLTNGKVVWSASGSSAGWGRESVSGIAHELMSDLIEGLKFTE